MRSHRLLTVMFLAVVCSTGCRTTVGNYFANRVRDYFEIYRVEAGVGFGLGASVKAYGVFHGGLAIGTVPRFLGVGWNYGEGHFFALGPRAMTWDSEVDITAIGLMSFVFWNHVGLETAGAMIEGNSAGPPITGAPLALHWESQASPWPTLSLARAEHSCFFWGPMVFSRVGPPGRPPPYRFRPRGVEASAQLAEPSYGDELGRRPAALGSVARQHFMWSPEAKRLHPRAHVHALDLEASVYAGLVYVKIGFSPGELSDFLLGWFGVDIAGDDWRLEDWDRS